MRRSYLEYPFALHGDVGKYPYQSSPTKEEMQGGQVQTSRLPAIPSASPNTGFVPPDKSNFVSYFPGGREPQTMALKYSTDFETAEDRLRLMESRLGGTEKSNRALLEEVIRLQGELRMMVRRNEESLKDEKVSRQQMEGSMQIVNDLITQLSNRIRTAEEKILEEKSAISSLVNHTKGVEKAVVASQKNLTDKKDTQTSKIQELSLLLSDVKDSRDQLEKQSYAMAEELRNLRAKVDGQGLELNTTVGELKMKSRRLEEENKIQYDALRKQGDIFSTTETSTHQLRGQVENRLTELRDVILELRTRQDQEANDRRTLENAVNGRLNTVQQGLADQNRKREEAMHAMDMIQREKEHNAENDKLKLQGRMTETMEEVNRRLLTKEIKLREELQDKFVQLERTIQTEQQTRMKYESALREENDKRWHQVRKVGEDEMGVVKETFQSERQKNKDAIQKLDESISLLEKHLAESKRQSDKVVAAEIKSRKLHEKTTADKLEHLNEKLTLATSSLQQAIGGAAGNLNSQADKLRADMKSMISTSEQATTRSMTDMDARLQSVKQKLSSLEQQIDGRISEGTAILAQNLREKMESVSLWQDVTSQTIRELNTTIQGLPNDIYAVEEKYKLLKSEVDSRVTTEADARIRDIEYLKHELSLLKNKRDPQAPTMQDLQETQSSIRKLAESIQTVKTVVGMKIQSEQKLRVEGLEDLQIQINRLKSQMGIHSAVNSTMPVYMRNDMDSAYEMEDFLRHDITQDVPYGRSSYRQQTTRSEQNSRGAGDPNGYAAQYSRNRPGTVNNEEFTPRGGLSSRTPLDPVKEDKDDEDAWNLLHTVAFANHGNNNSDGIAEEDSDANRAPSNVSQRSRGKKDESKPDNDVMMKRFGLNADEEEELISEDSGPNGQQNYDSTSQDDAPKTPKNRRTPTNPKTPERAVTRHNSYTGSPVDVAQSASLKGAGNNTERDQDGVWASVSEGSRPKSSNPTAIVEKANNAKTNTDTDKESNSRSTSRNKFNNKLDWHPGTPDGRKSTTSRKSVSATKLKTPSPGEEEKEDDKPPLTNRLAWEPATPTKTETENETGNDTVATGNETDEMGKSAEENNGSKRDDARSAEQILAEV